MSKKFNLRGGEKVVEEIVVNIDEEDDVAVDKVAVSPNILSSVDQLCEKVGDSLRSEIATWSRT
jgi:hypothetical protein